MSIQRFGLFPGGMKDNRPNGPYVMYDDHLAEMAGKDAEIARLRKDLDAIGKYACSGSADKVQLLNMLSSIANTCEQALRKGISA